MNADGSNAHALIIGSGYKEERSQNVVAWSGSELMIGSWDDHWVPKIANEDGTNIRQIDIGPADNKVSDWR